MKKLPLLLVSLIVLPLLISCSSIKNARYQSPAYRQSPDLFTDLSSAPGSQNTQWDDLRFSNTSTYSKFMARYIQHDPGPQLNFIPKNFEELISLPPPPANSSLRVAKELEYMVGLKKLRTPVLNDQLKKENSRGYQRLAHIKGYNLSLMIPDDKVSEMLSFALLECQPLTLYYKKKFDRVRPSVLRPDIQPVFTVPLHPAYPSGHATEAYLLALLFAELDPTNRQSYLNDGLRIGINRELAGLHYPSDTAAGVHLATKTFELLMKSPEFLKLFSEARSEWQISNKYKK